MEQFYTSIFLKIGRLLEWLSKNVSDQNLEGGFELASDTLDEISRLLSRIGCTVSSKSAIRLSKNLASLRKDPTSLRVRFNELRDTMTDEIESQLFLWVPPHRAEWYSKKAEAIAGAQWCSRFGATIPEIEEAAKCYVVGRNTAAAFHLMRATESGTKALGLAIGLAPAHPGWKLVFQEVYAQYKSQKPRHVVWSTHEAALIQISGDLRTISHVWRNDLAHFVDTYNEDEAREMFTIVPVFMRNLSGMIDENGRLYP